MAPQTRGFFAGWDTQDKKDVRRLVLALRYWWPGGRASNSAYLHALTEQQIITLEVITVHGQNDLVWHQVVENALAAPRYTQPSIVMAIITAMERHAANIPVPQTRPITSLLRTPQRADMSRLTTPVSSNECEGSISQAPEQLAEDTPHTGTKDAYVPALANNTQKAHNLGDGDRATGLFDQLQRASATASRANTTSRHRNRQPTPDYFRQSYFQGGQATYTSPYGQTASPPYSTNSSTPHNAESSLSRLAADQTADLSALDRIQQVDEDRLMALRLENQQLAEAGQFGSRLASEAFRNIAPKPAQTTHGHPEGHEHNMASLNESFDFADQQLRQELQGNFKSGFFLDGRARIEEEERQYQQAMANSLVDTHRESSDTMDPRPRHRKRPSEDTTTYLPPAKRVSTLQVRPKAEKGESSRAPLSYNDHGHDGEGGLDQGSNFLDEAYGLDEADSSADAEGETDIDVPTEGGGTDSVAE